MARLIRRDPIRCKFLLCSDEFPTVRAMPATPHLRPATMDEITETLAFALRYDGRKRVHHADTMMARITAERLVRHLTASGFVLMKTPIATAPTTSDMPSPGGDPSR